MPERPGDRGAELIALRWAESDQYRRLLALVLWGAVGAVALALLGLPPVDLHGPTHYLGIMDPMCGMTRAVRFFARGDLAAAWRYNPASFALALLAAAVLVRAAVGFVSNRWLELEIIRRQAAIGVLSLAVAVLWFNQQQHVAMLR